VIAVTFTGYQEVKMACQGYDHKSVVKLNRLLTGIPVPVGEIGTVLTIDRQGHLLDVDFGGYGVWRGLDAHAFSVVTPKGNPGSMIPTPA
jgi:hypothetical protein